MFSGMRLGGIKTTSYCIAGCPGIEMDRENESKLGGRDQIVCRRLAKVGGMPDAFLRHLRHGGRICQHLPTVDHQLQAHRRIATSSTQHVLNICALTHPRMR